MRIAIIGAGAAGMIMAATILENNPEAEVLLFDRNSRIGRKVAISGGGRCNVTTGITDPKLLLTKYPRGADFLKFAFKQFGPEKVVDWFETRGVPLKTEADNRVFPATNNSESVVELFESIFAKNPKYQLHLSESIIKVEQINHKFTLTSNKSSYEVDILALTTGGNAYSHTGSKGDGYKFSADLGHSITELGPSLNSFEVKEDWVKQLSGLSLKDAVIEFQDTKLNGPFLFTHFGISGPLTFAFAAHIPFREMPCQVRLNPFGADFDLNDLIQSNGKKSISNVLSLKIPSRLSRTILEQANIDPNKKSSELSKNERQNLLTLPITLLKRRPGDEFVTAGGIKLEEVSPKTMQSKLCPNLFFAGEILDIDGYTGGFNLQSSWATGRLAGQAVSRILV